MKNNIMVILAGMFLLSLSFVSAFGVSTPYWDENPLKLAPGESMDVELVLQNMAGAENDATLRAEMTDDGRGVASLIDDNLDYFVPFGSDDVPMRVRVIVPMDIAEGGVRDVEISFTQVSSEDAGMVSVSGGFTTKFPVFVVGPDESVLFVPEPEPEAEVEVPAKKSLTWVWGIIAILVLVSAWFAWKKFKK
jgi:hypothetical protein